MAGCDSPECLALGGERAEPLYGGLTGSDADGRRKLAKDQQPKVQANGRVEAETTLSVEKKINRKLSALGIYINLFAFLFLVGLVGDPQVVVTQLSVFNCRL